MIREKSIKERNVLRPSSLTTVRWSTKSYNTVCKHVTKSDLKNELKYEVFP